jgi:hypothetical protein
MNVATNGYGRIDSLHVAFLYEDFTGLGAEVLDLLFGDGFALAKLDDLLIEKACHV